MWRKISLYLMMLNSSEIFPAQLILTSLTPVEWKKRNDSFPPQSRAESFWSISEPAICVYQTCILALEVKQRTPCRESQRRVREPCLGTRDLHSFYMASASAPVTWKGINSFYASGRLTYTIIYAVCEIFSVQKKEKISNVQCFPDFDEIVIR